MPTIDRASANPLYQQVYEQIAHGIESGLYAPGRKLPSIRECARELGVSNTTIELAYQKLTEEGYVQARRGSGYTICAPNAPKASLSAPQSADYLESLERLVEAERRSARQPKPQFDFAYDEVDPALFPYAVWARISRDVLFNKGAEAACLYNDRQGLRELRDELAHYLSSEYGISCIAEQVLVMPTTRDLVSAVMGLFDPARTTIVMEEPGYDEVGHKMRARGFTAKRLQPSPVPPWDDVERIIRGADIVFATPSCQFPSNQVMPLELREKLVGWAAETGAYLIDDEYGWEFQTGIDRAPTLATFDTCGRVITMGTFSNSFAPSICLSYAVLPPQLMLAWRERERGAHPQVPWQTQAAMALFMREGHWRAHVRRIRTSMQRKREILLHALREHMGDAVEVVSGPSSLFVLVQTRDGRGEEKLIRAAAESGVRVYPTARYWSGPVPENWHYVLVGYAGIPAGDIDAGVRALAKAWGVDG